MSAEVVLLVTEACVTAGSIAVAFHELRERNGSNGKNKKVKSVVA